MSEYDISAAFEEIEAELIRSMARNFRGHRDWELAEGFDWPMWQAEQLKALERYRRETRKAMGRHSAKTDRLIDELLETTFQDAAAEQERKILQAIRKGAGIPRSPGAGEGPEVSFRSKARKLDALREAVKNDLHTAETATLRMAEDVYRKTIFNAQVYANTGAGTLWQAVDMATRSFLAAGLGAVRYRDGRQVNAASYAEMAIRTANKRAYLTGEGAMRQAWGVSLVVVTRRGAGCPYCVKWQGRVYVDDVWSGGRPDGQHPLLSTAIAGGLYHPNCKDSHTTFFPGVSTEPEPLTAEQQRRMIEHYNLQQKQRYYERQVRKYKRLETGSLDPGNVERHKARRVAWQTRTRELVAAHPDVLRREYAREKVRIPVANAPHFGIIGSRNGGAAMQQMESPIERGHTGKGNPNAILHYDIALNRRQQGLLDTLVEAGRKVVVRKSRVNMADLSALTAKTGSEFALFTKGAERMIIRGDDRSVSIDVELAEALVAEGYRWSGHTHPGADKFCLVPSDGDKLVLAWFHQRQSAIYNSAGQSIRFNQEGIV